MSKSPNAVLIDNSIQQPNSVVFRENNLLGLTPEDVCSLDFTNIDREILELPQLEESYRKNYPNSQIVRVNPY